MKKRYSALLFFLSSFLAARLLAQTPIGGGTCGSSSLASIQ